MRPHGRLVPDVSRRVDRGHRDARPDTALTIRNSVRGGRLGGIGTALGVSTGQLIWAAATGVGLVALLLASEPVFRAVRLAGAVYLIWLGLQSLRAAFWLAARGHPV